MIDIVVGDGSYLFNGMCFYFIGVFYVYWIFSCVIDDEGQLLVVYSCYDVLGLWVIDDWFSFGQCIMVSGMVVFDNVCVLVLQVLFLKDVLQQFNNIGLVLQLIQVVIDVGIVYVVVQDIIVFVIICLCFYVDSGLECVSDDFYILCDIGNLSLCLYVVEVLLEEVVVVFDSLFVKISFEQMV